MSELSTVEDARKDIETQAVIDRIHQIGSLLRDNAAVADRDRRLPDSSVDALRETGALRLSTLRKYGGLEVGARSQFEVIRTIGNYDPAAAWAASISNGTVLITNRWPEAATDRVFADGPVGMASVFTGRDASIVRDGDGYRINGKWPFASNIMHSDWAIGAAPVFESPDGEPSFGFALLRKDQFSIKDTWYVVGLRGTGSNTIVVEDQWVPADQVVLGEDLLGPAYEADPNETLGRRLAPMTTMITGLTAAVLGGAQAALEFVTEHAKKRSIAYSVYTKQSDSRVFVRDVAHAAMKLDTALLHLQRSADAVDSAAVAAQPLTLENRARSRGDVATATYEIAEAVNDLMWAHGTAAFAENALISRLWRDVNTGVRHAMLVANLNFEVYGGALLDVDYPMQMV
jgi:alkylation response protein AidB-like acyl-CoA dehydrogenase